MSRRLLALTCVMTLSAASMATPASARTDGDGAPSHRKTHRAMKQAPRPMAAREACTKTGCQPLPPGCSTTMEQSWAGPTGYEIIHCP